MNFKKKKKKNIHVDLRFKIQRICHLPFYDAYQDVCAPNLKYLEEKKEVIVSVKTIVGLTKILLLLKRRTAEGKMLCKYSLHRITT